jgi:protein TonB
MQYVILLATAWGASAADTTLRIAEAEGKKAAIEKPAPEYPLVARQLKVIGKVSLEATVTVDGQVSDIRIVSGNPILTKPAAEALKKWRFKPFKEDGKPVAAVVTLSFEFDTH